jgi:hypothetical protein
LRSSKLSGIAVSGWNAAASRRPGRCDEWSTTRPGSPGRGTAAARPCAGSPRRVPRCCRAPRSRRSSARRRRRGCPPGTPRAPDAKRSSVRTWSSFSTGNSGPSAPREKCDEAPIAWGRCGMNVDASAIRATIGPTTYWARSSPCEARSR